MEESCTTSSVQSASNHAPDSVGISLLILSLILGITTPGNSGKGAPADPAPLSLASINPNTAPWWELMILPDIGNTTANKIVEYRDAEGRGSPVFQGSADLEVVPGIGPKTARRIGPYLRFND